MGSWPVIIPPGPGVLCAYGDATTRLRDEASRTYIRRFTDTSAEQVVAVLEDLAETAAQALDAENVPRAEQSVQFQVDLRYHGQGLLLTVDADLADLKRDGLGPLGDKFDEMHRQLFTFALETDKEVVNLRAAVQGEAALVRAESIVEGGPDSSAAKIGTQTIFADGADHEASIYDRSKLCAGNVVAGPAVVMEMDSTTLILPEHAGEVDALGNILIRPVRMN